jgi:pimeloyl-ACP methyl ester carboxylesterase
VNIRIARLIFIVYEQKRLRAVSLLVAACVLSACASPLGDTEAELALEDIAAGFAQSRLKQQTPEPARISLSYRIEDRHYKADLYQSPAVSRAGIVLVPGVVPAGKDDLRLVVLANTLARLRFAVLVPDIEGLRRYKVRGRDVEAVADAFRYMTSQPALAPRGRVGFAGFSYGAGPVLLAALETDIQQQVRFILAMGGYHDLHKLVTYFTTGHYYDEASGQSHYRPANPYATWVFALSNAELLERPEDRTWLSNKVMAAIDDGSEASKLSTVPELAADTQALLELLNNREPDRVPALIRQLSLRIRTELTAINPAIHDLSGLQAQVILVHGRNDDIIPYTESIALAQRLPPEKVQLFLIEGVAHVDIQLQEGDIPKLVEAMRLLLDQRSAP